MKSWGIALVVTGVVLHRNLPEWWHLLAWIPIIWGIDLIAIAYKKEDL